ncbi:hypothetical protein VDGL01_03156 [Verticillium dahliae]
MFSSFKTSSVDSNKALAKRLCRVGPARVPIPGPLDIAVEGSLAENRSSSTPLSAGRRSSLLLMVGTSWCSFRARIEKHPTNVCRTTRRGHQKERPRKTVPILYISFATFPSAATLPTSQPGQVRIGHVVLECPRSEGPPNMEGRTGGLT